jgi:hypothetical protein
VTDEQGRYWVEIKGIGEVIYREPERMVVFAAHMRDHEVHLALVIRGDHRAEPVVGV